MARFSLTFTLALLCLLAGCGGFSGQQDATVEETVTPAPVPSIPTERAEGVSEHEINAPAVASAHHAALANRSYTTRTRIRWRGENGSTFVDATVHRVDAGGQRYHVTANYADPRGEENATGRELWSDGDRTVLRVRHADGVVEFRRLDDGREAEYPRAYVVNTLFARLEPRSVRQTADGSTVVSGPVEDVDDLWGPSRFRNENNATASARITADGYVERIAMEFDATVSGRPVDARVTIDFANVGSTAVSEPDWVENASDGAATSTPLE